MAWAKRRAGDRGALRLGAAGLGASPGAASRGGRCPRFGASSAANAVPTSSPLDTGPYGRGQRTARCSAYGLVGRLSAVFQRQRLWLGVGTFAVLPPPPPR